MYVNGNENAMLESNNRTKSKKVGRKPERDRKKKREREPERENSKLVHGKK